ncbi:MAG: glycosyltransferase family 4 protein [Bacteroidota bacterium]
MRLAVVALSCPNGGMLHYASQLANALAKETETHFFTPLKPELGPYLSADVAYHPTIPLSIPGDGWKNAVRQLNPLHHRENARRINRIKPDIVHFVTEHPANSLLMPLLKGKICFTHHDPVRHLGEESRIRQFLNGRSASLSDRVIVHGEALRGLLEQRLPSERISVIPHGDYGFLRHFAGESSEEPMILCFGRLVPYKGVDVLCKAERFLRGQFSYEVVIAGEGDPSHFEHEIEPNSNIRVINRFLSDPEVAQLFQRARLVVLPYLEASQSGVLAIAFAFSKPAIVTHVGGLPEAVGNGKAGLIVPPNDPEALAEAIRQLWHSPALCARLGAAGQELIEHSIGWPIIARKHLALYEGIR